MDSSGKNSLIPALVRAKVVKRQYHTWFDWKANNANSFFGMFGEDFKDHMKELIFTSPGLEDDISAFMEIGRERNRLVHEDYASYTIEKTAEEIYGLYMLGLSFVSQIPGALRACANKLNALEI